ncbi:MAG: hypothetical protein HY286_11540 [Planctomycetes bacterium]|nr:hypothetical protein [Planctomycetota bacterium]
MPIDPAELAEHLGPFAAFVAATFDRSGLPLVVGAVCTAVGLANGNAPLTLAFATAGMIAGDLFLYELGRRSGVAASFTKRLFRPLRPLRATARAILKKWPALSLLFGRYVAGAGILIPMLAGGYGIPRRRAYGLLIFGSTIYILPWCGLAFYLGNRFRDVVTRWEDKLVWFAIAGIVSFIMWFAYRRVRRKAQRAAVQNNNLTNRP